MKVKVKPWAFVGGKNMDQMAYRNKLTELVEKYRYVNFQHNGRTLEEGLDCLGFMVMFYKDFGIEIPSGDGNDIEKDWYRYDPERYLRGLKSIGGKEVELHELAPLDLIYFSVKKNIVTHTGIMVSNREFVHMSPRKGFTLDSMARHWRKFRGGIRLVNGFIIK